MTKKLLDIDELRYNAIILHGGTAEEFNIESIKFKKSWKIFKFIQKKILKNY
ncbi:hypothetical protein HMPREF3225_00982 [Staphylococcus lugdunensis]|uniref:Uncharacterized protein n=1 Tax=Staphylococcus lugdunensis TaxID=28035 RepID=A0ABD4EGF7_STALU|nr:hypothetical protein HMPREF3225_00982 [Staphylococcus lugdunensis]